MNIVETGVKFFRTWRVATRTLQGIVEMATVNPANSTEISEIQRRMAEIRHDIHADVIGAVQGVRSLTDWRGLARGYPLVTLGIAIGVGYLVVPRRRRDSSTFVGVEAPAAAPATMIHRQESSAHVGRSTSSVLGTIFALVAPVAVRAAQNYAMHSVEAWLAQSAFRPSEHENDGRAVAESARTADRSRTSA